MQVIFMPFSDKLTKLAYQYPDTLSLTFCIKVASVLVLKTSIVTIFVFNIIEPVFDGLKFRLKQPLKLFVIGYMQNSIWKHLEAANVPLLMSFSYELAKRSPQMSEFN
jgi:hypothetical protein